MGNPQNLYLYSLSGMRISLFLKTMLPYTLLSGLLLFLSLFLKPGEKVSLQSVFTDTAPMERKPLLVYSLLFFAVPGLCAAFVSLAGAPSDPARRSPAL